MALKELLEREGISQRDVANGSGIALSAVNDIVNGKRSPTTGTVDAILSFLRTRIRRRITYEEVFASSAQVGR